MVSSTIPVSSEQSTSYVALQNIKHKFDTTAFFACQFFTNAFKKNYLNYIY